MNLQNQFRCGAFALAFAAGAFAADTHDYSSYVTLKGSAGSTITVDGGYPGPALWDPEGEMTDGKSYLVPANVTLKSSTKAGQAGGTWPGDELAVAGNLQMTVSSQWTYAPTIPHLALLPGARVFFPSKLSAISGTTLDIRGTTDNPSVILGQFAYDSDSTQFPRISTTLTCTDTDGALVFCRSAVGDDLPAHAFYVKKVENYKGAIVVDGDNAWLRTWSDTFVVDGTLELRNGGSFYADTQSPTVGSLVIGSGSTVKLAKGKAITVRERLQVAEGGKIELANPFGDWTFGPSPSPTPVKFLTLGANVERPVDYGKIVEVAPASDATGAIPSLVFAEQVQEDGSVDVTVTYREVVKVGKTANNTTPYHPTKPTYTMLSDYVEGGENGIWPDKDYYTENSSYCQGGAYTFPGHSLTVVGSSKVLCYGCVFTCSNLCFVSGVVSQPNCGNTTYLAGKLHLQRGSVEFGANQSDFRGGVVLSCDIDGTTDLRMTRAVSSDDLNYRSSVTLSGDNTAFSGKFIFDAANAELRVAKKESLGGPIAESAADGVSIADTSALKLNLSEDTMFDDLTRGWTFGGASTLAAGDGFAVKVLSPITVEDTLTKTGACALEVGDVNGGTFVVSAGALGAAKADAFADLANLTFGEAASFAVDVTATDEALKASGADFSATTLTVPAGGVPVVFDGVTGDAAVVVATFAAAADAEKFVLRRPRGFTVKRSVEEAGGKFVLKADIAKSGVVLVVR